MCEVDVIMVSWNAEDVIGDAVLSCMAIPYVARVIVVDNGSTDDTLSVLTGLDDKRMIIIKSNYNMGFARACNLGAMYCKSKYILFLNPDTRVTGEAIGAALDNLEKQKADVVGVKMIDENGHIHRSCSRMPNLRMLLIDSFGLNRINPLLFKGYFMTEWDHTSNRYVDHVIGAFYFLRRQLYLDIGGMDERFFLYYEDLDLSLRIQEKGGRILYLADVSCFHEGGGTSKSIKARRLFYVMDSRVKYAYKNLGFLKGWIYLISMMTLERFLRYIFFLIKDGIPGYINASEAYEMYTRKIMKRGISSRD